MIDICPASSDGWSANGRTSLLSFVIVSNWKLIIRQECKATSEKKNIRCLTCQYFSFCLAFAVIHFANITRALVQTQFIHRACTSMKRNAPNQIELAHANFIGTLSHYRWHFTNVASTKIKHEARSQSGKEANGLLLQDRYLNEIKWSLCVDSSISPHSPAMQTGIDGCMAERMGEGGIWLHNCARIDVRSIVYDVRSTHSDVSNPI